MRPPALLATALGVFLPLACVAPEPSDPAGHAPVVAPASAPVQEPAPVAPASAPAPEPDPVAQVSEPVAPEPDEPVAGHPAGPVGDCGLRATIAADRDRGSAIQYTLTLKNEGAEVRTLVIPGDGSVDGRRTPILTWSGTRGGKPARQLPRSHCGMMNAIEASEIFTLEPGASHTMSTWLSGPSYGPGRYEVRLRYRNDPGKVGNASLEVAALLARTSPCEVTSAPLAIEVP